MCLRRELSPAEMRALLVEKIRDRDGLALQGFPGKSDANTMARILSVVDTLVRKQIRFVEPEKETVHGMQEEQER